jgi:S-sulfo-L-cysteine synthase (O-acetyl-L-serine-dependent)
METENILDIQPNIHLWLGGNNERGSSKLFLMEYLVRSAYEKKQISPGQEVIEVSTGNSGVALARILEDNPVSIILPNSVEEGFIQSIRQLGGTPYVLGKEYGFAQAIDFARELAHKKNGLFLDQFSCQEGYRAYADIAHEIASRCPKLDKVVCAIGTGSTLSGFGCVLKSYFPAVSLVGVLASDTDPIYGLRVNPHMLPVLMTPDEVFVVKKHDAVNTSLPMGVQASLSTAACLYVSQQLISGQKNILVISVDGRSYHG